MVTISCKTSKTKRVFMSTTQNNSILSQLTQQELAFFSPHMELLSLIKGDVLFDPENKIEHYYFPLSCSLELSMVMADGKCGATVFIDSIFPLEMIVDEQIDCRSTVRHSGLCYRIPAWVIHEGLRQSQRLLRVLLKEAVKISRITALDSVCLRSHSLKQITAKLILISIDDSQGTVANITHQEIANSLGARRAGVTLTLGKLKDQNLISTGRGHIELLDRAGLEQVACKCYKFMRQIKPVKIAKNDANYVNHD
jgi:CRP-like cAMP-binding protein